MSNIIRYKPKELIRFEKTAAAKRDLLIGRLVRLSSIVRQEIAENKYANSNELIHVIHEFEATRVQAQTFLDAVSAAEESREALWEQIPDGTRARLVAASVSHPSSGRAV